MSDEFWEGTITVELNHGHVRALRNTIETYKRIPVGDHPEGSPPSADFDVLGEVDDKLVEKSAEKRHLED